MAIEVNIDQVVTGDAEPEAAPHRVSAKTPKNEWTVKFTPTASGKIRAYRLRVGENRNSGVLVKRLGMVCGTGDRCGLSTSRPLAMNSGTQVIDENINTFALNQTFKVTAFACSEEDGWTS